MTKPEIEMMIWEVDENLDQRVDFYEFELMYKRCIYDKSGLGTHLYNLMIISLKFYPILLFNYRAAPTLQPGGVPDVRQD